MSDGIDHKFVPGDIRIEAESLMKGNNDLDAVNGTMLTKRDDCAAKRNTSHGYRRLLSDPGSLTDKNLVMVAVLDCDPH
jgi:hypothetical protein